MGRAWLVNRLLPGLLFAGTAGSAAVALPRLGPAGPVLRTVVVGSDPTSLAVDTRTGRVFVVNRGTPSYTTSIGGFGVGGAGSVSVLDARTGDLLRTVPVGPDPRAVAVDEAHDLAVVVNDDDASATLLDARNGAYLRTVQVGPHPHAVALDPLTERAFVVATGNGTVSVLDTGHGTVLRTVHVGATYSLASVAVDPQGNRAYIANGPQLFVLDARSGAPLRTISLDRGVDGLVVDEQARRLYLLDGGGIQALDLHSGAASPVPYAGEAPATLAVAPQTGGLYLTTGVIFDGSGPFGRSVAAAGSGALETLDPRTGTILGTVGVGVAPLSIAVDERTRRVFVLNAGGDTPVADPWGWLPGWLRDKLPFVPKRPTGTRTVPGSVTVLDLSRLR